MDEGAIIHLGTLWPYKLLLSGRDSSFQSRQKYMMIAGIIMRCLWGRTHFIALLLIEKLSLIS